MFRFSPSWLHGWNKWATLEIQPLSITWTETPQEPGASSQTYVITAAPTHMSVLYNTILIDERYRDDEMINKCTCVASSCCVQGYWGLWYSTIYKIYLCQNLGFWRQKIEVQVGWKILSKVAEKARLNGQHELRFLFFFLPLLVLHSICWNIPPNERGTYGERLVTQGQE